MHRIRNAELAKAGREFESRSLLQNIMKLISLPDCKSHHQYLVVGKDYEILKTVGNCFKIEVDDFFILILASRFEDNKPLVAESVDATDSKSVAARHPSSSLGEGTNILEQA